MIEAVTYRLEWGDGRLLHTTGILGRLPGKVTDMPTLHILRAGTPQPRSDRWGTSFALEMSNEVIMVDCGPCATAKLIDAGVALTDANWLFFTHHHSDHNADYPSLMLFRWDQCTGEEPPLKVVGPPPTEHVTERLFGPDGAFRDDIAARIN
ncbi:MAG: MBL fold metallo-hydrolase, partial [Armatimonadia bacterium]|nr:MBL fold metallo-hydrolase [Armatimonadia bacterium]